MTEQHPITPPPELLQQWTEYAGLVGINEYLLIRLATQAAQWGYEQRGAANEAELQKARDEELEGCVEWVVKTIPSWAPHTFGEQLRDARRFEPPSLKEQALAVVENSEICDHLRTEHAAILRRALESLPS